MTTFNVGDRVRICYPENIRKMPYYAALHNQVAHIVEIKIRTKYHDGLIVVLDGESEERFFVSSTYLQLAPLVKWCDIVRCVNTVMFPDGNSHVEGTEFTVTSDVYAYFQWAVERGDYAILPKPITYVVCCTREKPMYRHRVNEKYTTLADAVVHAYAAVDADGWHSATVHADLTSAPMLYGVFQRDNGIESIKASDCNVTRAEIVAALQKMV